MKKFTTLIALFATLWLGACTSSNQESQYPRVERQNVYNWLTQMHIQAPHELPQCADVAAKNLTCIKAISDGFQITLGKDSTSQPFDIKTIYYTQTQADASAPDAKQWYIFLGSPLHMENMVTYLQDMFGLPFTEDTTQKEPFSSKYSTIDIEDGNINAFIELSQSKSSTQPEIAGLITIMVF